MSRGLGTMQQWIDLELSSYSKGRTVAEMHRQYLREEEYQEENKRSGAKDHARAVRNSMTRVLRRLEKLGKARRDDAVWRSIEAIEANRVIEVAAKEKLRETAYHEAGHAVIGLAGQLPIGLATIVPKASSLGHVIGVAESTAPVGPVFRRGSRSWKQVNTDEEAGLDPFGNPVRRRVRTAAEHAAEIVMCIAGPMAQAEMRGDYTRWRDHASNSDMEIARRHRRELGNEAKSWEEYEQETLRLVRKYWAMIEAVAAKLLKEETLSGYDIDAICRRVVRRQHLKIGRDRRAAA
jgi:hypothetical protein